MNVTWVPAVTLVLLALSVVCVPTTTSASAIPGSIRTRIAEMNRHFATFTCHLSSVGRRNGRLPGALSSR